MSENLKPCPFCGGPASVGTIRYGVSKELKDGSRQNLFFGVNCEICGSTNMGIIGRVSEDAAREHWNRRVDAAVPLMDLLYPKKVAP